MYLYIILIVVFIILIKILADYNNCVKLRNTVKQSKSTIDVYLNQRFDLIPNLVECVKGYSKHEKELLTKITEMRKLYINNNKNNLKQATELNNNLNKVIAVAENYPELKASQQYLELQKTLSKLESQLQAARRMYNNEVTNYNTYIGMIPKNITAFIFGFKQMDLFEIEDFKKETVNINLGE